MEIDEEKLIQLISMGFNNTEARLSLRSNNNDFNAAIEEILKVINSKLLINFYNLNLYKINFFRKERRKKSMKI